jgi:hypothetical protein
MKAKRRMTVAEFEAVKPLLRISADRIEAARCAVVDGQTLQGVANLYGWTRQAVDAAVRVVWATHARFQDSQRAAANATALLPPGWEQVTLVAPRDLVERFREEVSHAAQGLVPTATSARKRVARTNANAKGRAS